MPLMAREVYLGFNIKNPELHIAECHGCGQNIPWEESVEDYIPHTVMRCLSTLRVMIQQLPLHVHEAPKPAEPAKKSTKKKAADDQK